MAEKTKISRTKRMPTFKVELWNKDNYVREVEKYKHLVKRMWSGRITHIQSGKSKFFRQVSDMLEFMEENRV